MENSPTHVELLPDEILLKTILFLSYEDQKKCKYVCKRLQFVAEKYGHLLKKIEITKLVIEKEGSSIKLQMERSSHVAPKKIWSCVLRTGEGAGCSSWNAAEFYRNKGHTGLKWGAGIKGVEFVVEDSDRALEEHLVFICRRAFFTIMELRNVSPMQAIIVQQIMKHCKSTAQHLKTTFVTESLSEDHYRMIKEIGPQTLTVLKTKEVDVDLLFQTPSICSKVWYLTIVSDDPTDSIEMTDEFLNSLTAREIDIKNRTHITLAGFSRFLQGYISNRADFCSIELGLSFPDEPEDPALKRTAVLSQFRSEFSKMPQIANREEEFKWNSGDYLIVYDLSKELICLTCVSNPTLSELGEDESDSNSDMG